MNLYRFANSASLNLLQNFNTTGIVIKLNRIKYYSKITQFFFTPQKYIFENLIFIGIFIDI